MSAKPGNPTIRVIDGLKLGGGKNAWNPCSTRAGHLDHHCDLRLVVGSWWLPGAFAFFLDDLAPSLFGKPLLSR
jgi:hypothetical protein